MDLDGVLFGVVGSAVFFDGFNDGAPELCLQQRVVLCGLYPT